MLGRRSLRSWGGRIALLAMWLQLGFAFGHIHPDDIFGPLGHPVVVGFGVTEVAPPGPAAPRPDADQFCAICANMALAAALVLPPPARPPPPPSFAALDVIRVAPPPLVAAPYLLFQTRAPPLA